MPTLAVGFIEGDGSSGSGIQRTGRASDRNVDYRIAGPTPRGGKPGSLVPDQQDGGPSQALLGDLDLAVLVGSDDREGCSLMSGCF